MLWASSRVGRPVKWVCERSEAFVSDYQGRDLVAKIELALDKRGKFLAMRGSHLSNIGAFGASIVPLRKGVTIFSGVYHVPVAHYQAFAVLSNTPPTTPYRSAGRPEATFIMERLCDLAALETGIDRIEIRRRNLIAPDELPYRTALGYGIRQRRIRSCDGHRPYAFGLDRFKKRRRIERSRQAAGDRACQLYRCTMGYPREWSKVTVMPDREIQVAVGTLSSGQGHETSFAQWARRFLNSVRKCSCGVHRNFVFAIVVFVPKAVR